VRYDLASREGIPLVDGTFARYANGYLFWVDRGSLFAAPLDPGSTELGGDGVKIAEDVAPSLQGSYDVAVSDAGTLVYATGTPQGYNVGESLFWLRAVPELEPLDIGLGATVGNIENLALSPDGRFVALEVASRPGGGLLPSQIWIYDIAEAVATRLTFRGSRNSQPRWLPDGRTVAYLSNQGEEGAAVWGQTYDRTGEDRLLFRAQWPITAFEVAPVEGLPMIVSDGPNPPHGLWLAGSGSPSPEPFIVTEFIENRPRISPDGRWVAYESHETGRPEVYVRSFPNQGRPWPISRGGGTMPVWSRSGREIFYMASGTGLMSATVELGSQVRVTRTDQVRQVGLLPGIAFSAGPSTTAYDAGMDDETLLVIANPTGGTLLQSAEGVVVVLNLFTELEARARR